ncbi:MAG: recombination mediator RecR [Planctomycetota bacterium]
MQRLMAELCKLPGIGRRSAERLIFHVLKAPADEVDRLARSLDDTKSGVRHCDVCYNLSERSRCRICEDPERDRSRVLVVEQPRDLIAIEQTGQYRGLYHVLMGRLSPLDGIGPDELTVDALLDRVRDPSKQPGGVGVEEIVLGLNPTLEGDGTALYVKERLDELGSGVTVTRLARGLPSGGSLEMMNKAVLADALAGRRTL